MQPNPMVTETDKEKINQFISYLLNSPNMKNENILVGESMIYNFIAQNREQLKTTFRGPGYFPHLSPDESLQALVAELYLRVSGQALEPVMAFINEANFDFLSAMPDSVRYPADFHKNSLRNYTTTVFKNREVRANFSSIYNMFQYKIIERYLAEIFLRRDFLYNELVRVQKTYLEVDEYITYMKTMLLIKNAVYIKVPLNENESVNKYNLTDSIKMPGKIIQYTTMLKKELKPLLPNINDRTMSLAIKSNLNESMTEIDESASRLLYILSARFHNYKYVAKVDRGAESPDKSWFAVARKNSKLFGFDKNMIDELYRIAGDNNW